MSGHNQTLDFTTRVYAIQYIHPRNGIIPPYCKFRMKYQENARKIIIIVVAKYGKKAPGIENKMLQKNFM